MRSAVPYIAVLLCLSAPCFAETPEPAAFKESVYTLGPVHVQKKYISMTGPVMTDKVTFGAKEGPLWVTGLRVDVLGADGAKESSEYLCHAWVIFGKPEAGDQRMLTISEGLDEMNLPDGFAVRVENKPDNAALLAQVLNNAEHTDKNLSYRLAIRYVDDAAAKQLKLRPLRTVSVGVMAKDANPGGTSEICRTQDEAAAAPGEMKSIVHFDVPPGRHEYRSAVPRDNPLYMGGTIHYIKLHLHPYGQSVALYDKTAGTALWTGHVQTGADRAILTDVDFYSSAEGLKIDPKHDYEIVSVYDNTTPQVTDAMAVLRLYIADDEKKPSAP